MTTTDRTRRGVVAAVVALGALAAVGAIWVRRGGARRVALAPTMRGAGPVATTAGVAPGPPAPASRGPGATVTVRIRDQAGAPLPARLSFVGVDGTPAPAFTTTDVGLAAPGAVLAYDRAFVVGDATLMVPPGRYEVWVSHGPEWDVAVARLALVAGGVGVIDEELRHVVDTTGWLSGDFHVHAKASFDSVVPMRDRVMQFAADGVDLIVATDHNTIADYQPEIAALGLATQLASLTGDEITTKDWGHFGAFPLAVDDAEAGRGAVPVGGRTPAAIFADVRARAPGAVLDVHHPRLEGGHIGYFHLAELDPITLRARRPGFSSDFDAIEVLNGYQDGDRKSLDAVLADWFAFLRHGQRVTGTGNSDSHHLTFNLGGFPRNFVKVADDRPAALDPAALVTAIRGGQALFTTGPFVEVTIDGHGLGDTVAAHGGEVAVHVRVQAPPWIALDRLLVLVDGEPVARRPLAGGEVVRFDQDVPVTIARDSFVIVRVEGDRPMAPVIGDLTGFRVLPLAITNPIWVDVDGDGVITPSQR